MKKNLCNNNNKKSTNLVKCIEIRQEYYSRIKKKSVECTKTKYLINIK